MNLLSRKQDCEKALTETIQLSTHTYFCQCLEQVNETTGIWLLTTDFSEKFPIMNTPRDECIIIEG